ncbi:MAG: hypothetical protein R3F62_18485 [Planctomycetota bacterium]
MLVDAYGHAVHVGERECSIQRKHQKLIESRLLALPPDAGGRRRERGPRPRRGWGTWAPEPWSACSTTAGPCASWR